MSLRHSEPMTLPERPNWVVPVEVMGYSLLTALMIVTPMVVFVPTALLHCALRNGRRAASAALAIAVTIPALVVVLLVVLPAGAQAADKAWSFLAAVTLAVALPSLVALPLVERAKKFGHVLMVLLVASTVGLFATELGSRLLLDHSPFAAQVAQAEETSKQFLQLYRNAGIPPSSIDLMARVFRMSVYVLPAGIVAQMATAFILSLLMLGRLKTWRERAALGADAEGLGAFAFRNFSLPDWLLFAFILGGLTPLATGMLQKIAANTLAVVVFLYLLQGLAIFRFLLVSIGARGFGTVFAWLLLALFTMAGPGLLLLGLAGLFDPFFDFRRFKKRKDDSNGNESHSD